MKNILCFIMVLFSCVLTYAQPATTPGNISASLVPGLRILVSPQHPIHIESGDDAPIDLDGSTPLTTKVYNSCHYRIAVYIENTTSSDITLDLATIWDAQAVGTATPAEWWSIDDKPNDDETGDDNFGLANRIPNTNLNDVTIPANDTILFDFYDPLVKLAVGRPLNVKVIGITQSGGNYNYQPIEIVGATNNEIAVPNNIEPSSCSFILRECIVAYPNPTIVDGNLLVNAIVENTGTSPITADVYLVLKQGNKEQIIDSKPNQTYDVDEQAIFNLTTATPLDPGFIPGSAEIYAFFEAPSVSARVLVKEYSCSNPITINIEDPCATGLVPEPVAPGTDNIIPIQKITTLTPSFLWKKVCGTAANNVTGYDVEVRDYLSNTLIATFSTASVDDNQYPTAPGTFRYSTQYVWTVTALSSNGNQTSIPFYFETSGPDNSNCQVDDIDQTIDPLLFDAVQYLCERGIVTPRLWQTGGSQHEVNPTDNIVREHLAWITAAGLYGNKITVEGAYFYTQRYPIPFEDLAQAADNKDRYAKLLTYLDYNDQITPFDGDRHNFQPAHEIAIKFALKVLLEAFNIDVNSPPSNPLSIVTIAPSDPMYKYVAVATQLGLLDHYAVGTNANDNIKRGDAFIILYKIMTHLGITHPTSVDLDQDTNYVESNFYGAKNYAVRPSLADGNFSSYAKTSFAIPGTLMPLVFEHSYASSCLTLPKELFPMNPVGKAWTHNHHGYIVEIPGTKHWGGEDDFSTDQFDTSLAIFLPGSQHPHIFRRNNRTLKAATKGLTYRLTEDVNNNRITIETMGRSRYVFEKLPTGSHSDSLYMLLEVAERNGNKLLYTYSNYAPNHSHLTQVCAQYLDTLGNQVPQRCIDLVYFTSIGNEDLIKRIEYPSPISSTPRRVVFTYDFTNKNLESYKDALLTMPCTGQSLSAELYFYDTNAETPHLLNKIQLPKGNYITNTYHDRKLKSTALMGSSPTPINQTTITSQFDKFTGERTQTVTSTAGTSGSPTSMTQTRNAVGYITETSYLRSDGNVDYFDIEYSDATFPQNPTKVTAYGVVTNMTYNSAGQMTQKDVISSVLGTTYTEKWNYDTDSLLKSYTNRRNHAMYYDYDPNTKNLIQVTDFENHDTNYEYYPNGLRKKVITATLKEYKFKYDDYGNLTKSIGPTGITTTSVYDNAGRLTQAIDPMGNITHMEYLKNDLPTKVSRTNNGIVHAVDYCYDANYNNIWIEDEKGQRTTMTYSLEEDYLTSIQFGSDIRTFTYTPKGLLDTETTPNGAPKQYQYNPNNELLEEDSYASYEYDPSNRDNLIRVRLLSNPNQEYIRYYYDDLDRVTHYTYHTNGPDYTVRYGYDEESNITSITYPDYNGFTGMQVDYTYNKNNQLKTVTALGLTWTAIRRADGSIRKIIYPNGIEKRYEYDNEDRVDDLGYFADSNPAIPSNTLSRQQFTIDNRGFFTQEIVEGPSTPTLLPDLDINFTHNSVNRIQTTTNTITGQSTNATYDSDGNQLTGHYTGMVWNIFEQLQSIQNATGTFAANYSYGVTGLRNMAQRTRNGITTTTNYFYEVSGVGHVLREERDSAGTITALDYIHGFGEILARIPTNQAINNPSLSNIQDTIRFFVSDMRGTVIGLTDYDQNFTEKYKVTSYGEMISHEIVAGSIPNYFIFVGAYGVEREDTLLYKMGVRYYDVEQVNFLSEDPIWDTNLYGYAGGNTVMAIDPDGREFYYVQRAATIGFGTSLADGPAPFGEVVAGGLVVVAFIADAAIGISNLFSKSNSSTQKKKEETKHQNKKNNNTPFYYITYTKTNPVTKQVYVGRTSGRGNPSISVKKRDASHHMNAQGFGPAVISDWQRATISGGYPSRFLDPAYWAIRGKEQLQIESYRELGISGNAINGVSPTNKLKNLYMETAKKIFGP